MSIICGHQNQWRVFKKSFQNNRSAHAYLFSGIDNLGKKRVALEFLKFVFGEEKEELIERRKHPDLLIIGSEKDSIQINDIREVQRFLSYKPYLGKQRAVIVDEAEKMNRQAQSCLLKTLEEPKGNALLILISSHPEMLLPTIYSRCQLIKFFPVAEKEIIKYLKSELKIIEKKARLIAGISQGRPGRAISFIKNPEKLEKERKILKDILKISDSSLNIRFSYLRKITSDKSLIDPNEFLRILQQYLRFILLNKIGVVDSTEYNYFPQPTKKLNSFSIPKLKRIIKFTETLNYLTSFTNINSKLGLEVLMTKL